MHPFAGKRFAQPRIADRPKFEPIQQVGGTYAALIYLLKPIKKYSEWFRRVALWKVTIEITPVYCPDEFNVIA